MPQEPVTPPTTEILAWMARFSVEAGKHVYWLIDHSGARHFSDRLRKTKLYWRPLWPQVSEDDHRAMPILVGPIPCDVQDASLSPVLEWFLERYRFTTSLTLLASSLGFEALKVALDRRSQGMAPNRAPITLRYFDTRILPEWLRVLSEPERVAFLSIAEAWGYLDRNGNFVEIESKFAETDSFESPYALEAEQRDDLEMATFPDAVLGVLRQETRDVLRTLPHVFHYPTVCAALQAAEASRIDTLAERALFSALFFHHGPRGLDTPEWGVLLARVKSGETTLHEGLQNR